ncbi:PQQ-binding-like beta-propeller repeat protein [Pirellulaceae bacterium SH449]
MQILHRPISHWRDRLAVLFVCLQAIGYQLHAQQDSPMADIADLSSAENWRESQWPNWRGPYGNGTSLTAKPPVSWDANTNIAWRIRVPGRGSSTPLVWGDQVIVLTAEEIGPESNFEPEFLDLDTEPIILSNFGIPQSVSRSRAKEQDQYNESQKLTRATQRLRFLVVSYDLSTGSKRWETEVLRQLPHEPCHFTNSFSSSSPLTDGEHIYAFFGSRGVFCLDMNGNLKWRFAQGRMQTIGSFGEGASPALFENYLIVPWDHEGESCLIALNARNGYLQWKTYRPEGTNWATPVVVEHNGKRQVIVSGKTVRSYKLETGELLWACPGQTEQAIPTPLVHNDLVFVTSGLRGWACFAISLEANGPVGENSEFVRWTLKKNTPYVPSPCLYDNKLFLFSENSKTLTVIDPASGQLLKEPIRLYAMGDVFASLGGADGKLFVTDTTGRTQVYDTETLELLSENTLGESINASLAFVGDSILVRTMEHLICIKLP